MKMNEDISQNIRIQISTTWKKIPRKGMVDVGLYKILLMITEQEFQTAKCNFDYLTTSKTQ